MRLAGRPVDDRHVVLLGLGVGDANRAAVGGVMEEDLDAGPQRRFVASGEVELVAGGVRQLEQHIAVRQHIGRQQHGTEQAKGEGHAQEDVARLDPRAVAVDPGGELRDETHGTESFR